MKNLSKEQAREARRLYLLTQERHKKQRKAWKLERRARRRAKQAGLAFNAPRD